MASHRSAAFMWGVPRPGDDPVDLILPSPGRRRRSMASSSTVPATLLDLGTVIRHDIPTCKIVRWVCDLGAVDPKGVHPALATWSHELVPLRGPENAIRVHSRRPGGHGVKAFRAALADWLADGKLLDSELERRMTRLGEAISLAGGELPRRDPRLRGRLPGDRHADRLGVRQLGVPRQGRAQVRV